MAEQEVPEPVDRHDLKLQEGDLPLGLRVRCFCAVVAVADFLADVLTTAADFLKVPMAACVAFLIGSYISAAVARIILGTTPWTAVAFLSTSARNTTNSIASFIQSAHDLKEGFRICFATSLEAAVTMLCLLPIKSRLAQCAGHEDADDAPLAYVDYPTLMEVQGRAMDALLVQSENGLSLAVDVKYAEIAIGDLVVVVNGSGIPNRNLLVAALRDFVIDSKGSGRALQKLSSKIYSAMDTVIAFDEHVLRTIESTRTSKSQDIRTTLLHSFEAAAKLLGRQVTDVLLEAMRTMATLDILEGHLSRVQVLCVEEGLATNIIRGSLLSEFWTAFGGNKGRLLDLERQATVLQNVDTYRRLAVVHVATTMQTLLAVEEDLSQLIQKLSTPGIMGSDIPVEVHVASIHLGVQRLKEERLKVRVGNVAATTMRTQLL